jgi:6,7-dimethyl-8-ribityllumazine synthase
MTEQDRHGTYNPFEDTGDWPFRESAPPPSPVERPEPQNVPFDREEVDSERHPVEAGREPEPEPVEPEPVPEPQAAVPAELDADEDEPLEPAPVPEPELEPEEPQEPLPPAAEAPEPPEQHAPGGLEMPEGPEVLEGAPNGFRRTVAVVVSRFNADVTNRLLESALDALTNAHVSKESITIVPVPGAFELPLAAMALAKTRRFSCVVALGCVIRGETPHFDFVAGEAASGLQLAAIETGVPVSVGLLTCETKAQAEARVDRGADAARAALEMADLFTQVRTRSARSG